MSIRVRNEAKPSGDVWDVFARTRDEPELHQIGDVIAPSLGLARAYAYQMYQESPWVEMIVARRADIVTVIDRS
jgi:1,2-phenylacetyl-CoA epoxidase PaaB subunit